MASFAAPVVFPYITFKGKTYFEGSIAFSINLSGAIARCKEIVADVKDITIDIIYTSS